ncbi:MAG: DUF3566 domain-containing protein [Propionibacteriaceae bacterium]
MTEPKRGSETQPVTAVPAPKPKAEPRVAPGRPVRVRKARLRLTRIDPWSMFKTAMLFSVAGGIMFWVATYVTWGIIQSSGLFESLNKTVSDIVNSPTDPKKFQIEQYISTNKVLGIAAVIAAVDVVIMTALATLGAFLYNLSATMLGGLEVTLAED